MTKEITVTAIKNGGSSPDGNKVWLDVETADGAVRLNMGREHIQCIPILALMVLANAEKAATGGAFYSFSTTRIAVGEDRSSQDVLVMVELAGGRHRPLSFQLPEGGLDQMANEIDAIRKRRSLPSPSERRDN